MTNEYFKAANKVMELASQCKDSEIASILRDGSLRISRLAQENDSLKQSEESEEAFTGTE